jgi:iron(III) transport system substrate-binding protein
MRFFVLMLLLLAGCTRDKAVPSAPRAANRVVLYCSVDDVYAKPVIAALERQTGLRIDVLYDTEAAKTAGLANRIRAEKGRPQGDVFWSSALLQTLLLEQEDLLAPYQSPSSRGIPAAFKGRNWAAPGVRSRVIVWHKSVKIPPRSRDDLLSPRFRAGVGISNPQFGTASDEAAALGVRWGGAKTLAWYEGLKRNGAKVLPGNSVVAQRVARGELLAGITDTDDYLAEKKRGGAIVAGDMQMMAMPQSVAILKNARHPAAARRLVDALLREETESLICASMPGVFPTRPETTKNHTFPLVFSARRATADTARWPLAWQQLRNPLAAILLAPDKS